MQQQVGQVLDKYELLERVGQGGMAIVYRGLDRSLKRVVAVKVLHKHLADNQEARERFEREAQAVAKLRHDNILEIFDFSAKPDADPYIVTEFIDGHTLKQLITARPIGYPEIGAMIILQVGRALAHAHAGGILHRDVKPENIMIRSDGVVKLMDFGISHMVDLERLTVTGQLLGSPAYMAPEHVEGRQLDYRTDVFAAGIVLYQLSVGKLPFEGKNPHEVLKRIAECRYVDPRQANPKIPSRLGRIIVRAMAREPADRYPAIGDMVTALHTYLGDSGLESDRIDTELAQYFADPVAYEKAFAERLISNLTTRGVELLAADDRAAALDAFDRVLTLDPENAKVLGVLDGLNRRARWRGIGIAVAAACVIGGGAFMVHKRSAPPAAATPPSPELAMADHSSRVRVVMKEDPPPTARPETPDEPGQPRGTPDDGVAARPLPQTAPPDAGSAQTMPAQTFSVQISVFPSRGSKVDDGRGAQAVPTSGIVTLELFGETRVVVTNPLCQTEERMIAVGSTQQNIQLSFLPAAIKPSCTDGAATVQIKNQPATLGQEYTVSFGSSTLESLVVPVSFITNTGITEKRVTVTPGKTFEVTCD